MRKNIDYWEGDPGDEQPDNLNNLGAMELAEMIEQRIESGNQSGAKGWKKEVNSLIDEYNTRFGKTFTRV